jgi:hypothetical protein
MMVVMEDAALAGIMAAESWIFGGGGGDCGPGCVSRAGLYEREQSHRERWRTEEETRKEGRKEGRKEKKRTGWNQQA